MKEIKKWKAILWILFIVGITVTCMLSNYENVSAGTYDDALTFYNENIYNGEIASNDGNIYFCKRNSTASGSTGERVFTVGFKVTLPDGKNIDLAVASQTSNGTLVTVAGTGGQVKLVDSYPNPLDGYTYDLYVINYNELVSTIAVRLGSDECTKYFVNTSSSYITNTLEIDSIMTSIKWNNDGTYTIAGTCTSSDINNTSFSENCFISAKDMDYYWRTILGHSSSTLNIYDNYDKFFTYSLAPDTGVYPTYVKYYVYNSSTKNYDLYSTVTKTAGYSTKVNADYSALDGYEIDYVSNESYTIEFDYNYYFDSYLDLSSAGLTDSFSDMYNHWVVYGKNEGRTFICDTTTKVYLSDNTLKITTVDKSIQEGNIITDSWLLENITAKSGNNDLTDDIWIAGYGGLEKCISSAKVGHYIITYEVSNSSGKVVTNTAKVIVTNVNPDINAENKEFLYGEEITEAELLEGVTAYDIGDGDITDSVVISDYGELITNSTSNPHTSYTITYLVSDSNGGTAIATAEIKIVYKYVRAISIDAIDTLDSESKWLNNDLNKYLMSVLAKACNSSSIYQQIWVFNNEDRIAIQTYMTEHAPSEETTEWFLSHYLDNRIYDAGEEN